jgi:hypothetical protein
MRGIGGLGDMPMIVLTQGRPIRNQASGEAQVRNGWVDLQHRFCADLQPRTAGPGCQQRPRNSGGSAGRGDRRRAGDRDCRSRASTVAQSARPAERNVEREREDESAPN